VPDHRIPHPPIQPNTRASPYQPTLPLGAGGRPERRTEMLACEARHTYARAPRGGPRAVSLLVPGSPLSIVNLRWDEISPSPTRWRSRVLRHAGRLGPRPKGLGCSIGWSLRAEPHLSVDVGQEAIPSPHDAAELVSDPLAVTRIQRKATAGVGIHGTLRRPKRGLRRWRCGSEDDQHEDLKPQYGGADRHEP
jgi:hypothetical protein